MIASKETRRRIESEIGAVAQSGDIIFRYGEAKHYEPLIFKTGSLSFGEGLRFSRITCDLMSPPCPFSHAAILDCRDPIVRVWDMSDEGLRRFELRDWMRETHQGGAVEVRRFVHPYTASAALIVGEVERIRDEWDPDYDERFKQGDRKFYCLEVIQHIAETLEIPIAPPVDLRELRGYGWWHSLVAKIAGIDLSGGVVFPGNDTVGMRSTKCMQTVYSDPGDECVG